MSQHVVINVNILLPYIVLIFFSFSILSPLPLVVASSSPNSSSNSTAPRAFHRRDPLRSFKYYNGDYDLRNKHYWASAAFTGIHGYAVAGVWSLCGLGFGTFLVVKRLMNTGTSSPSPQVEHSDSWCHSLFFLVVLFTLLVFAATATVLVANQHYLRDTNRLKETVFRAGDDARRDIHRVNKAMRNIQGYLCSYNRDACEFLNATSYRLGNESLAIKQIMEKNEHTIHRAVWTSYITNLVTVTLNLVFVVGALVLLLLHWHPGFILIIFLCWILTMACWILTGIDFFLHTFAEDTCEALQDFQENRQNNSLSTLLPCAHLLKSQGIMVQIGKTLHNFIAEINSEMVELPKLFGLSKEARVVLKAKMICDPFSSEPNYSYMPNHCPKHSISIGDLPDVLTRFTCYNDNSSSSNTCEEDERILPYSVFLAAKAYSCSIQDLINIYPYLENLVSCSSIKEAIYSVISYQCKPFKFYTQLLWASMLSLSIVMVGLILIWVFKAYQDQGKCFSRCSIIPHWA